MKQACIKFDWITFRINPDKTDKNYWNPKFNEYEIDTLIYELLGLNPNLFVPVKGRLSYFKGRYFNNITVLYDGTEEMGVCFVITGKGVNYLYSLDFDFKALFMKINSFKSNISRLDVSLDLFNNEIDYTELHRCIKEHQYVTRWRGEFQVITEYNNHFLNCPGYTFNFGSRYSECMLRIYNKAYEQGLFDEYWCRMELELKRTTAIAFIDTWLDEPTNNTLFSSFGFLVNDFIRFVERREGTSDWTRTQTLPILDWWQNIMDMFNSESHNFTTCTI